MNPLFRQLLSQPVQEVLAERDNQRGLEVLEHARKYLETKYGGADTEVAAARYILMMRIEDLMGIAQPVDVPA